MIPRLFVMMSAVALPLVAQADPQARSRPHIVVLLADDLGYGDVGFQGSRIPTPNLDALAARGTRLSQFYVQPVCSPTRAALLTGRYPLRLGLQCGVVRPWAEHGLPLDERTLADELGELGYETVICGKWHLGHARADQLPTRRGFDHQYGHYNGALDYFSHVRDGGFDWHEDDRENRDEGYTTDLIADHAVEMLAAHDSSEPLFLYVPFNAPHTPLQAPAEWIAKFADIDDKRRRVYAAMVACMDAAVGRILAGLDANGFLREDTLVFFCSDNGGIKSLGSNGPLRGQKGRLYEGGIRVPAVVSWPGRVPAGEVVDTPLHIVDLFPTVLRLAGGRAPAEPSIDGRDAWAAIVAGGASPHAVIVHNVTPWSGAVRKGRFKLVHNGAVPANAVKGPAQDLFELFDIAADIGERRDVAADHPEVVAELRALLERLRADALPPTLLPNTAPEGFVVPDVWGEPQAGERREVTAPPQDEVERLGLAPFYRQYLSVAGFPVVASDKVSPYALLEAGYLIDRMLEGREDIRQQLIDNKVRFSIMAPEEMTTAIPEHSDLKPAKYWDRRARGLGATRHRPSVSCGEENLLGYPGDPYWQENILIHEFAHAIHDMALKDLDPTFDRRLQQTWQQAMKAGLWQGKYAATNHHEYWAEGVQSWYDDNRPPDHDHNHVDTRVELIEYDPGLSALIREVFGEPEWRYQKPGERDAVGRAHLDGYDPKTARPFAWDPELVAWYREYMKKKRPR